MPCGSFRIVLRRQSPQYEASKRRIGASSFSSAPFMSFHQPISRLPVLASSNVLNNTGPTTERMNEKAGLRGTPRPLLPFAVIVTPLRGTDVSQGAHRGLELRARVSDVLMDHPGYTSRLPPNDLSSGTYSPIARIGNDFSCLCSLTTTAVGLSCIRNVQLWSRIASLSFPYDAPVPHASSLEMELYQQQHPLPLLAHCLPACAIQGTQAHTAVRVPLKAVMSVISVQIMVSYRIIMIASKNSGLPFSSSLVIWRNMVNKTHCFCESSMPLTSATCFVPAAYAAEMMLDSSYVPRDSRARIRFRAKLLREGRTWKPFLAQIPRPSSINSHYYEFSNDSASVEATLNASLPLPSCGIIVGILADGFSCEKLECSKQSWHICRVGGRNWRWYWNWNWRWHWHWLLIFCESMPTGAGIGGPSLPPFHYVLASSLSPCPIPGKVSRNTTLDRVASVRAGLLLREPLLLRELAWFSCFCESWPGSAASARAGLVQLLLRELAWFSCFCESRCFCESWPSSAASARAGLVQLLLRELAWFSCFCESWPGSAASARAGLVQLLLRELAWFSCFCESWPGSAASARAGVCWRVVVPGSAASARASAGIGGEMALELAMEIALELGFDKLAEQAFPSCPFEHIELAVDALAEKGLCRENRIQELVEKREFEEATRMPTASFRAFTTRLSRLSQQHITNAARYVD
ncbi:uncharacterized protein MYCFIDRAFT_179335 [Pseudocercospora fijiensis CIRAD86]|uniref:Uncharacterized protein n=1 Tax=Pseudocercospora fijiensis (strain CIRAD86) TaxID=383855 RepID=M2YJE9_PSEFD|nr:uncharacterized protein MYCFIDRAFT_179335 [Pseudocercospora fijiensis CIRAD86]EME77860.1 hypothetical protein MYCFIDRAFT_179335 [Pseudocercospora fijiensis CIRAD86]